MINNDNFNYVPESAALATSKMLNKFPVCNLPTTHVIQSFLAMLLSEIIPSHFLVLSQCCVTAGHFHSAVTVAHVTLSACTILQV